MKFFVLFSMMESCSNLIRVRVDLSELNVPFCKQVWLSVDRAILHTVQDFKHSLYKRFKLTADCNTSLYLKGFLLLDDEPIAILRDDDVIRVVSEDNSSFLGTQDNGYDFTSDSSRSFVKQISDDYFNTSSPAAKSPNICGPQVVLGDGSLVPASDVTTILDTSVFPARVEFVRKKNKKSKKSGKLEKGNSFISEERVNNSACGNMCHGVEHDSGFSRKDVLKQNKETIFSDGTKNSKKHKVKGGKHSIENVIHLAKRGIDASGSFENGADCSDSRKIKRAKCVSLAEDTAKITAKSNSIYGMTTSKKLKELSSNNPAALEEKKRKSSSDSSLTDMQIAMLSELGPLFDSDSSDDVLQKGCSSQKRGEESNRGSDLIEFEVGQNINCIGPQSEPKVADMKNSVLSQKCAPLICPPINNSSIQVEGDCTQSLGNNCPKKKRKRKRRKGPHSLAGLSEDRKLGNTSLSSSLSVEKPISSYIHAVGNESLERKHIRFNSVERSLPDEAVDSGVDQTLMSKYSVVAAGTNVSADVGTSQVCKELFEMVIPSTCETPTFVEKHEPNTLCHQENSVLTPPADGTSNKSNDLTVNNSALESDSEKSCSAYPPLNKFPSVGDSIAYKVLELSGSYCPEVSNYKRGKIVNINVSTDVLEIDLLEEEQVTARTGKFENLYPGEEPKSQVVKKVHVHWSELIEPKLIPPGTQ